jgi:hypothetical protein
MGKEITTYPEQGRAAPRERTYFATLAIGAAGAISSTDIQGGALTVVKTAAKTGRYSFTLHRGFGKIKYISVPSIEGPADAAFGNTNANAAGVRNVNASAGTFDIQLFLASTGADTDAASGYNVRVEVAVTDYTGP